MNNFFFIEDNQVSDFPSEDEPEVQPEPEAVLHSPSFWPFPVVNSVRSAESQDLINKGYTYGT